MPPAEKVVPANGKTFQLDELYKMLNCKYVEMVELGDGRIALVDEEACGKQLLQNFHIFIKYNPLHLFGPVLVCESNMFD